MERTRCPVPAPLRVLPKQIAGPCFNRVRLALLRLGTPLRLALPGLSGLEAILDDLCWLCVDATTGDRPVLAWTAFRTRGRALHEPVTCELRVYHEHGGLVIGRAMTALETAVASALADAR